MKYKNIALAILASTTFNLSYAQSDLNRAANALTNKDIADCSAVATFVYNQTNGSIEEFATQASDTQKVYIQIGHIKFGSQEKFIEFIRNDPDFKKKYQWAAKQSPETTMKLIANCNTKARKAATY